MRKALRKEQELRDDMIQSLMPNQVAQEVMQEVCNDSESASAKKHGKRGGSKKNKSNERKLKSDGVNYPEFTDNDFKPEDSSFLAYGDDSDIDDFCTSKKKSTSSNPEDGRYIVVYLFTLFFVFYEFY